MIFTSYYAKFSDIEGKKCSISNTHPSGVDIETIKEFVPYVELVQAYKERKIDEKEFARIYMIQLSSVSKKAVKKIDGSTLFCYEKPNELCHRIVLRKWLAKMGKFSLEYKNSYSIAIVGSRDYKNKSEAFSVLARLISGFNSNQKISFVSGGAKGADTFARDFAEEHGVEIKEILPDWDKYGKSAGFIRNKEIWENADFGLAFWDGESRGTKHSLEIAKKTHKSIIVYNYKEKRFHLYNWEKLVKNPNLFAVEYS